MGMGALGKYVEDTWRKKAEDAKTVIEQHALAGGAAGAVSGLAPVIGAAAAGIAMVPIVWSMYYRINKVCGIKLSKAVVRSLAGAIVSNIIASGASYLVGLTIGGIASIIPIAGNVAAASIYAAANYGIVRLAGEVYLGVIQTIIKTGNDSDMSESEMKNMAKGIIDNMNVSAELKKAKKHYSSEKKKGNITGKEKIDIIEE
jgi:uncharacterized protein (DUF697 family)